MDPEQHLQVEALAFALGDDLGQPSCHSADLLEVARRAGQVHHRAVARVRQRNDRRHDPRPVAEPFEDRERPFQDVRRLGEERADRRTREQHRDVGARSDGRQELVDPTGHHLSGVPRAPAPVVDHGDLAEGTRQPSIVM